MNDNNKEQENSERLSAVSGGNMQPQLTARTVSKQFLLCPYCGEYETGIDHLINRNTTAGPWYCDNCGKAWSMKFYENGDIEIIQREEMKQKTLVALRHNNIFLLVEGMVFNNDYSSDEYYYNEHTCPTNYLRRVEVIIDGDNNDPDPHGLFEYMKAIPYPENYDICNASIEDLEKLFSIKIIEV